jgi:hypothetical protein
VSPVELTGDPPANTWPVSIVRFKQALSVSDLLRASAQKGIRAGQDKEAAIAWSLVTCMSTGYARFPNLARCRGCVSGHKPIPERKRDKLYRAIRELPENRQTDSRRTAEGAKIKGSCKTNRAAQNTAMARVVIISDLTACLL